MCFKSITWFAFKRNCHFRIPRHLFLCPELSMLTMSSVPQQMIGQGPQFPFPMQGVQSSFQPLQLGNNPLAASAARQSQKSPATQTQPIQESAGLHTQYSTGPGVCYQSPRIRTNPTPRCRRPMGASKGQGKGGRLGEGAWVRQTGRLPHQRCRQSDTH